MIVYLDFETRSAVELKSVGAARYAMDPTTEVLLACWAVDDGPVKSWRIGCAPPEELVSAVRGGATVCAHNAMFEFFIWAYVCEPRLGWGPLSPYQMDCTMSRSYVMSLPGSLDEVTALLRVEHRKNKDGKALIQKFGAPRKRTKNDTSADAWNAPEHFAEEFDRFDTYCRDDVEATRALSKVLPELSPGERSVYHMDLVVNARGFRLDTELMRKADAFIAEAKRRVDTELGEITGGVVSKSTQAARMKDWLTSRGVPAPGLGKEHIQNVMDFAALMDDDVAGAALDLRRQGAKATSLSKFKTGVRAAGFDERVRGVLKYHKASTGRWAGALYQPHNLERIDPDEDGPVVERMLDVLSSARTAEDAVDWCEMLGLRPMRAIGKCTRAMIVAKDGHELIGCDYSNVEGRGSAWLAGETWKIDAFRAYDDGTGPDLYKLSYSRSFGDPVETIGKGKKRQIGKVQELALGYQGAVGAFMSMAANYGMDPDTLLATVKPSADVGRWQAAQVRYAGSDKRGLSEDQWTALRYVVDGWRTGHPRIVQGWWDLQDAVVGAVSNPGNVIRLFGGRVRVYCARNMSFLYIYLPSGRPLAYFRPRLKEAEEEIVNTKGEVYTRVKRSVVVEGTDSRTGKWGRVHLYGGLEWENVVQGMCRDLLVTGLMACERAGYPVVLHVHDEGVFEVPEGEGSVEEVQRLMSTLPPWAAGFPLSSAAWRDARYVK